MTFQITNRIDNITGIRDGQKDTAPPCPKSVKIELTARCNFNCAFCATGKRLRDKRDMDWGFYQDLLRDMRTAGVDEVGMFYLGESMLLDWLPDAIAEAKRVGFPYVFLTTNGSLATAPMVRRCMDAGLDSLKFSLNYSSEEQFCEIAQVKPGLYHKMISNIQAARAIRDEGYDCGLFASYIQYDGDQGERMKKVIKRMSPYLDEVYALPLYSQADLTGKSEAEKGWAVTAGNMGRLGNLRDPIPCWAVFTEARVTHDGHLSACCFDHDGRFHMGDLKEMSFMEAWHSIDFQALRAAHLKGDVTATPCEKCVAYQ